MPILTRTEYVAYADVMLRGDRLNETQTHKIVECIASYRQICHHLVPLLHNAIAECDDAQKLAHLRSILKDLQQGEA